LPEVARLELTRRDVYHAADVDPLDAMELTALSPEALMQTTFEFVPAMRLFKSDHPAHSIWHFNMIEQFKITNPSDWVLLTRPELDVMAYVLDASTYQFLERLLIGGTLEAALDRGVSTDQNFDLSQALGLMMSAQIIHKLTS